MMTNLLQYYGVDWLAMLFTLVAIYQLGNHKRIGFVLMIIGNGFWIVLGMFTASLAMIVANTIFAGMNVRGLWKWSQASRESA